MINVELECSKSGQIWGERANTKFPISWKMKGPNVNRGRNFVAVTASKNMCAVGDVYGNVVIFFCSENRYQTHFIRGGQAIQSLAFVSLGREISVVTGDQKVFVVSCHTGELVAHLPHSRPGHPPTSLVHLSSDISGLHLCSLSRDKAVLWKGDKDWRNLQALFSGSTLCNFLAARFCSRDETSVVVILCDDDRVRGWDISDFSPRFTLNTRGDIPIDLICFAVSGSLITAVSQNSTIFVWGVDEVLIAEYHII